MQLLQRDLKDPRVGFATITRVETSRDLGHARVWVSVYGTDAERAAVHRGAAARHAVAAAPARGAAAPAARPAAEHPAPMTRSSPATGCCASCARSRPRPPPRTAHEGGRRAAARRAAGHGDLPREPGRGHAGRGHRHRHRRRADGQGLRGRERDPPPPLLAFLPRIDQVRNAPALEPDVAVVVDAGDLARTGKRGGRAGRLAGEGPRGQRRPPHLEHRLRRRAVWVDPTAAATCEMVALLLPELGVAIDQELATVLMTGIVAGHAHLRAPERHAAHPAGRGRAGGGRGAAVGASTAPCTSTSRTARWRCGA